MIKGLNVYCFICGGPTCKQFADCDGISLRGSNPAPWDELPGLTSSDASWLCDNTVAVYADCISPPGIYQRKENRLRPAAKIETVLGRMCFSGFAGDLDNILDGAARGKESHTESLRRCGGRWNLLMMAYIWILVLLRTGRGRCGRGI